MRQELGEDSLDDVETDKEYDRDSPISPLIVDVIFEAGVDVVTSSNELLTWYRSGEGADLVDTESRRVLREGAAKVRRKDVVSITEEIDAFELVRHRCREPELEGIDVTDPEQPSLLRKDGNKISGVSDHKRDNDTSQSRSLIVVGAESSEETKETGECEVGRENDDVEREESAGGVNESSHEVDDDTEE